MKKLSFDVDVVNVAKESRKTDASKSVGALIRKEGDGEFVRLLHMIVTETRFLVDQNKQILSQPDEPVAKTEKPPNKKRCDVEGHYSCSKSMHWTT
jgi:hypothetical protein